MAVRAAEVPAAKSTGRLNMKHRKDCGTTRARATKLQNIHFLTRLVFSLIARAAVVVHIISELPHETLGLPEAQVAQTVNLVKLAVWCRTRA